jgi:hypothetical protein
MTVDAIAPRLFKKTTFRSFRGGVALELIALMNYQLTHINRNHECQRKHLPLRAMLLNASDGSSTWRIA